MTILALAAALWLARRTHTACKASRRTLATYTERVLR